MTSSTSGSIGQSDLSESRVNVPLFITRDGVVLAPFHDLVSTAVYRDLTDKLALKIGGEDRSEWIQKLHCEDLAEISGANPRILLRQLDQFLSTIVGMARDTADELAMSTTEIATIEEILAVITARAAQLAGSLP